MRRTLAAVVATAAIIGFSGAAFAGSGCGGGQTAHSSSYETATNTQSTKPTTQTQTAQERTE